MMKNKLTQSAVAQSFPIAALLTVLVTAWYIAAQGRTSPDRTAVRRSVAAGAPEYPCTWPSFPRFQINRAEAHRAVRRVQQRCPRHRRQ